MTLQLGRREDVDHSLVTKFAAGQVTYYKSLFGVYFKTTRLPINTVTIDENKIVHGFFVSTARVQSSKLTAFAAQMKNIMKIHSVYVKTMRAPEVYDLN